MPLSFYCGHIALVCLSGSPLMLLLRRWLLRAGSLEIRKAMMQRMLLPKRRQDWEEQVLLFARNEIASAKMRHM